MTSSLFDNLINSGINASEESSTFYEYYATPLKSAQTIRQEHREQMTQFLKFGELIEQFEKAGNLLKSHLPGRLTEVELSRIQGEIANASSRFLQFLPQENKPILLQEVFGFSNETLLSLYSLASDLMEEGNYQDAYTVLVPLTTLAPHVASYWIAEGICLQQLGRHGDALTSFTCAKLVDPGLEEPYIYSIYSYIELKDQPKAQDELSHLQHKGGI